MINVFEETPEEKEQYVIDMLQRGYSYKSIMKECHVSPSTISKVKKAMLGSTKDDGSKQTFQISKETQALKLFSEGRKPIEVAIELDIATDYVFVIHQRYQSLRNLEWFNSAFKHVKGNIIPFLRLFDLMKGLAMIPEQVQEQVKYGYRLPQLQSIHAKMSNQIQVLASKHWDLDSQLESMAKQVQQCKNSLQFYDFECVQKTSEITRLSYRMRRKNTIIQRLDNDVGY